MKTIKSYYFGNDEIKQGLTALTYYKQNQRVNNKKKKTEKYFSLHQFNKIY